MTQTGLIDPSIGADLTPQEWRALIYLHRVDEISQLATSTEIRSVVDQFKACNDPQVRAAMAGLVATLHLAASEFADAEHWMQTATGEAIPSTWIAARVTALHANQLMWNGDNALAEAVLAEADPIGHPLSNLPIRILRARIAYNKNDFPLVRALLDGLVAEDCHDPLFIGAPVAAVYVASIALVEGDLSAAEIAMRRALLTSTPGSRANALLVDRLGHVMARCGLTRETEACRQTAQAGLARWPSHALGSKRSFDLLLAALGLRRRPPADANTHPSSAAWPAAAGNTGQRVVELQSEAEAQLRAGERESARGAIVALLATLTEHLRAFESIESRSLAVRQLADLPTLAIGLARLGDPADAIRIAQATMRIIVADQTRGELSTQFSHRLRSLLDWAVTLDQNSVNQLELIDLDLRILRLDRQRRAPATPLPSPDWIERPLSPGHLVFFEESDDRLWRVISASNQSHIVDLGPVDDIERSVRAFRLATAALGLEHPDADQRLSDAATSLDTLLFSNCSWSDGERLIMVPGEALVGLPWRVLPTLRRVRLEVTLGEPSPDATVPERTAVVAINGPGTGTQERREVATISACYANSTIVEDAALTAGRLIDHFPGADVIHVAAHGRLDRTQYRFRRRFDDRLSEHSEVASREQSPTIVVFGSCDLTLGDLGRSGLAWLLLGFGVSHVVATTIDLDDAETQIIMPALHHMLAAGVDPGIAVAQLHFEDPRLQVAANSLLCISAGSPP